MKVLKSVLGAIVVITAVTGCYTHKERVVERERPVVQDRVIERDSGSTTIQTPDSTIRVR